MSSVTTISIEKLARLVGTPKCPAVIDVRTEEDFAADPRLIPGCGAPRSRLGAGMGRASSRAAPAVVVCQRGQKLSEGAAAWLRHEGVPAEIAGGRVRGLAAGRPAAGARRQAARRATSRGRTVWVTRARPKIDRIACPWLIRRFVDPAAVFLFVAPAEVGGVAERFGATPFDIEDVFWSHRGETCTFDTMVEEFGLRTEPLLRLARSCAAPTPARLDLAPGGAGPAGRLARPVAHVRRRPGPARGRHGALRRLLSLVPRRHRRDAQLAVREGGRLRWRAPTIALDRRPGRRPPIPPSPRRCGLGADRGPARFGGPAGQIAVMHRILVEEKRWIGEARFLHALNYCMLLPGPEAQQLAIYIGWLLHRTKGGLVAGTLFVLPGFARHHGAQPDLRRLRRGRHRPGAVLRPEGGGARHRARGGGAHRQAGAEEPLMVGIAAAAFVAIFFFDVPFPLIILAAGLDRLSGRARRPAGLPRRRRARRRATARSWPTPTPHSARSCRPMPARASPGRSRSRRVCLVLWLGPGPRRCC